MSPISELFLLMLCAIAYGSDPACIPPKNIVIQIASDPDKQIEVEGSLSITFRDNKIVIKAAPQEEKKCIIL